MPSGSDNPARQRWVKKRIEQLDQQNEEYRTARLKAKFEHQLGPGGGSEYESIQKEHHREQVELLMLKNEAGVATPAERAALNKFLHKREGHVQGQGQHHHQR